MKLVVDLDNKNVAVLDFQELSGEIDVDDLTKIDHSNLVGEALTISTLLNKVGLMVAAHNFKVGEATLELDIYKANLAEMLRKQMVANESKVTIQMVDHAVLKDQGFQLKMRALLRLQTELEYLRSLDRALVSKDKKIHNVTRNLTPTEFDRDLIEGSINHVLIRKKKSSF